MWFEQEGAIFRGSLQHTNAAGQKEELHTWVDVDCRVAARAVGTFAAELTRPLWDHKKPPPPSSPPLPAAPACDPCAAEAKLKATEARRELDEQRARIASLELKLAAVQEALDEHRKKDRMDFTGWLSTGAFITANLTPNVGPGLWLGGELRAGPLSVELEARVVLPSGVFVATGPQGQVNDFDLSQVVALMVPCGRYLYFFGCAVGGAGAEIGRAHV